MKKISISKAVCLSAALCLSMMACGGDDNNETINLSNPVTETSSNGGTQIIPLGNGNGPAVSAGSINDQDFAGIQLGFRHIDKNIIRTGGIFGSGVGSRSEDETEEYIGELHVGIFGSEGAYPLSGVNEVLNMWVSRVNGQDFNYDINPVIVRDGKGIVPIRFTFPADAKWQFDDEIIITVLREDPNTFNEIDESFHNIVSIYLNLGDSPLFQ